MSDKTVKFIGRICHRHPELNGERYVIAGGCVKCMKIRAAKWKKNNKGKVAAGSKIYGIKNKQRIKGYNAKYAREHPESVNARSRKWRKDNSVLYAKITKTWRDNNRHVVRQNHKKWKARRRGGRAAWANSFFMNEIYDLCSRRNRVTNIRWHVDHIVPLKSNIVCGLHVENNLRVVPASVNTSKQNRYWPDMPT